jgi:hypothetical protein
VTTRSHVSGLHQSRTQGPAAACAPTGRPARSTGSTGRLFLCVVRVGREKGEPPAMNRRPPPGGSRGPADTLRNRARLGLDRARPTLVPQPSHRSGCAAALQGQPRSRRRTSPPTDIPRSHGLSTS